MKPPELNTRKQMLVASNRRAEHDYIILQRIEVGIVLAGTEVKALRERKANIADSYATFPNQNDNEFLLLNMHISPYSHGNRENQPPLRPRRLLVNAREAVRLRTQVQEKGNTLIPLSVYFSGPFVKIEIGVARAKKKYDKRETNKERESDREIQRKFTYR
ncbi:MAG: smpB [Ignavibacteria bacterium]|nr:smpB [Ignavibacteria bacterium]